MFPEHHRLQLFQSLVALHLESLTQQQTAASRTSKTFNLDFIQLFILPHVGALQVKIGQILSHHSETFKKTVFGNT